MIETFWLLRQFLEKFIISEIMEVWSFINVHVYTAFNLTLNKHCFISFFFPWHANSNVQGRKEKGRGPFGVN